MRPMEAAVTRAAVRIACAVALSLGGVASGSHSPSPFAVVPVGLSTPVAYAQFENAAAPWASSALTLLQINDVYSTVPVDGAGGLARVATLKRRIAAEGRTPFLVLAGDFLSTSVASTVFKGEQMIAALNAAGLDLATLGNHEFDFGVDVLLQRMKEAKFQWVVSNVLDAETGQPIGGAAPYVVRTFGTLRVGFIGLCVTSEGLTRDKLDRVRLVEPLEAAATYIPVLKKAGVDAIVALTHLTFEADRALAQRFPEIDVITGGHEHFPITAFEGRTLISKAGSEAKYVARIDLQKAQAGGVSRFFELVPINAAIDDEPGTAAVVGDYESRLGPELDRAIAESQVPLDGESSRIRSSETNLGNLIADAIRHDAEADVAIVNAGGIRGDRVHRPGDVTRRLLLELHPFGNVVTRIEVTGRVLMQALEHGMSRLPASAGQFPQVSGMTLRVDVGAPVGSRVKDVRINSPGDRPLDPDARYTLALPDFLLLGGDGYEMFTGQRVLISPDAGTPIAVVLERFVETWRTLSPKIEGRIRITRP